jgi:hypothetical protein
MFTLFLILVQKPAPASYIKVIPSDTSAQVTIGNPAPETSSYIHKYSIYLYKEKQQLTIPRQKSEITEFNITGLKPSTKYTFGIWARDARKWSRKKDKQFVTIEGMT